jgi:hypothetical protein
MNGASKMPNYLSVKWTVSRGRETYGYNICTLTDTNTGKRYRCNGGGYDMLGTVFGEWLQENYQEELYAIRDRAHSIWTVGTRTQNDSPDALYGMSHRERTCSIGLDGACGIESMRRIAEAIGLEIKSTVDRKGHITGFLVS